MDSIDTGFNSSGTAIAGVTFSAVGAGTTFDNFAGLNVTAITQLSAVGVNGAFNSVTGGEIGSPDVVPLSAAA